MDSIERSSQEDTFLVLFNTAISNLVGLLCSDSEPHLRSSRSFSAITLLSVETSAASFNHSSPVLQSRTLLLTHHSSNLPLLLSSRYVLSDDHLLCPVTPAQDVVESDKIEIARE